MAARNQPPPPAADDRERDCLIELGRIDAALYLMGEIRSGDLSHLTLPALRPTALDAARADWLMGIALDAAEAGTARATAIRTRKPAPRS